MKEIWLLTTQPLDDIRQVEIVLGYTTCYAIVGKEKTLELTQKIRSSEELEMDKMIIGRWLKERNSMIGIRSIRSLLTNNEKRIICA